MGARGYLLDDGRFRPVAVPGATGTLPFGINDRGQIVGVYDDADGRSHGFLLERGRYRTIDVPGATGTTPDGISGSGAVGINDRGQVIGSHVGDDGHASDQLGFTLERGRYRSIDFPGDGLTGVNSSNSRGEVVGYVVEGDLLRPDAVRGAVLRGGRLATFDAPGPPFGSPSATTAYYINDRGQVVGAKLPPPDQGAAGESGLSARATPGAGGPGPG